MTPATRTATKGARDLLVVAILGTLLALGVDFATAILPGDVIDLDAAAVALLAATAPASLAVYRAARDARLLERAGLAIAPSPEVSPPPVVTPAPTPTPALLFERTEVERAPAGRFGYGRILGYPLAGDVSAPFGSRTIEEHANGHSGVDVAAPSGTPVRAPAAGVVLHVFSMDIRNEAWAQWKSVFGNSVILDHGDVVSLFAHFDTPPVVREGQRVEAGAMLGRVGATGTATGPHLHWGLAPRDNAFFQRAHPAGLLDPLAYANRSQ